MKVKFFHRDVDTPIALGHADQRGHMAGPNMIQTRLEIDRVWLVTHPEKLDRAIITNETTNQRLNKREK